MRSKLYRPRPVGPLKRKFALAAGRVLWYKTLAHSNLQSFSPCRRLTTSTVALQKMRVNAHDSSRHVNYLRAVHVSEKTFAGNE